MIACREYPLPESSVPADPSSPGATENSAMNGVTPGRLLPLST